MSSAVNPPVADDIFDGDDIPESSYPVNWNRDDLIRRLMPSPVWACTLPEAERRAEPYTNGQLATIIKRSWQQSRWGRSR